MSQSDVATKSSLGYVRNEWEQGCDTAIYSPEEAICRTLID